MKKLSIIALIFLMQVSAQTKYDKLDEYLTFITNEQKFMGSVALAEHGKVVFNINYGFENLDKKIPASVNTQYKIGSITKTFTAVLIMKLIEEQRLTLDTKLSAFYKEVENADKISINDLLHHTSGIYNYTDDSLFLKTMQKPHSKKELLETFSKKTSQFSPGTKNEYSNSNYILLGYIIEDLTKMSYQRNIETKIINRLKLKNTSFAPKTNVAKSFLWQNDKFVNSTEWDMSVAFSAGGLYSTTNDLIVFMNALVNNKLVNATSLEAMKKIDKGMGKGLFTFPFGDRIFYGHNGGIESFQSNLAHNFNDGTTICVLSNAISSYDFNEVMIGTLSYHYKMPFQIPDFKEIKIDENLVKKYLGTYKSSQIPLKINIFFENDKLKAQATGQGAFELSYLEKETYFFAPAKIEIDFGVNSFVLKQGGMKINFEKE
jgi:CubicO group peptidase (beta-lactamase class C family)